MTVVHSVKIRVFDGSLAWQRPGSHPTLGEKNHAVKLQTNGALGKLFGPPKVLLIEFGTSMQCFAANEVVLDKITTLTNWVL